MKTDRNPKIEHANLPTEIMLDIFLRLTLQSIMRCKCVCKSWRDLIKTREFVESHFSRPRSVPCVALCQLGTIISTPYKIIEFEDTTNYGQNRYCKTILNFSFPHKTIIDSSANGLLFLLSKNDRDLFICNPITHEYIKLPSPVDLSVMDDFGFGASKLSGEYKVVRFTRRKCEVYSLRRGLWISVATNGDQLWYRQSKSSAISLNGNLHWFVGGVYSYDPFRGILCFDLETECFSIFSVPPYDCHYRAICALGGCLCLHDSCYDDNFVIWMMNKYGDDKSWTKEFVIEKHSRYLRGALPIKVFKDGDILFFQDYIFKLYYYSSKTRTTREFDAAGSLVEVDNGSCIYTPSFVPLKTLTMESNVISF